MDGYFGQKLIVDFNEMTDKFIESVELLGCGEDIITGYVSKDI